MGRRVVPLPILGLLTIGLVWLFLIPAGHAGSSLADARRGFATTFHQRRAGGQTPPAPPAKVARLVHYPSGVGPLAAYITNTPPGGGKHPAIVWITGGNTNEIDDSVFQSAPRSNDQTAQQYREAGIVTMYASLRGGNDNPGAREGFFGEIDDIVAAADYLSKQPGVDPSRIYLGGHSTGGTLVVLVAEATTRFRAVFAFGPVEDAALHQRNNVPLDPTNAGEMAFRAPIRWLESVKSPLFIFEGSSETEGNVASLRALQKATRNPFIHFHEVYGATHFTDLAPTNDLIAHKILSDTGTASNIAFSQNEMVLLLGAAPKER